MLGRFLTKETKCKKCGHSLLAHAVVMFACDGDENKPPEAPEAKCKCERFVPPDPS